MNNGGLSPNLAEPDIIQPPRDDSWVLSAVNIVLMTVPSPRRDWFITHHIGKLSVRDVARVVANELGEDPEAYAKRWKSRIHIGIRRAEVEFAEAWERWCEDRMTWGEVAGLIVAALHNWESPSLAMLRLTPQEAFEAAFAAYRRDEPWLSQVAPIGTWAVRQLGRDRVQWLTDLLCRKQHDYGHANIMKFQEFGVFVRLWDKLARWENLQGKQNRVEGETLTDTYADIAGYVTILAMLHHDKFRLEL